MAGKVSFLVKAKKFFFNQKKMFYWAIGCSVAAAILILSGVGALLFFPPLGILLLVLGCVTGGLAVFFGGRLAIASRQTTRELAELAPVSHSCDRADSIDYVIRQNTGDCRAALSKSKRLLAGVTLETASTPEDDSEEIDAKVPSSSSSSQETAPTLNGGKKAIVMKPFPVLNDEDDENKRVVADKDGYEEIDAKVPSSSSSSQETAPTLNGGKKAIVMKPFPVLNDEDDENERVAVAYEDEGRPCVKIQNYTMKQADAIDARKNKKANARFDRVMAETVLVRHSGSLVRLNIKEAARNMVIDAIADPEMNAKELKKVLTNLASVGKNINSNKLYQMAKSSIEILNSAGNNVTKKEISMIFKIFNQNLNPQRNKGLYRHTVETLQDSNKGLTMMSHSPN